MTSNKLVIFSLLAYMWYIGTAISAPILLQTPVVYGGYGFNTKNVGFIQFAPLIGIGLGEVFGHFFNDYIVSRYVKKHEGRFVPEARLTSNIIASMVMIPGLVILGQTLQHHLH